MSETIATNPSTTSQEVRREFVHATYVASKFDKSKDCLFVKEVLHGPDGRTKRNFRAIVDYQRPFYITKKDYQNHEQKKEFEHVAKLDCYQTNQARLADAIFNQLKGFRPNSYVSMRDMSESQIVYGTDVTTPVLLANDYQKRWPNLMSQTTLAVLDYETDTIKGHGLIISGVLSFKDKLHIAVTKDFLGNLASRAKEDIFEALNLHLKDYMIGRKIIDPIITICDTPAQVVIALMKSAHQWQPDIIGIWNISFDVNKMLEALTLEGIDPAQVFSDPSVPDEFKYFKWRQDSLFKMTASGKRTPKHPADQWHSVTCPASFYFICLMSLFKTVRAREQNRNDYKLDNVLRDYLKLGKLRFKSVPDNLIDLEWHMEMQRNHKIEYMVYMAFDGISCELLDEETNDVGRSLKAAQGLSELSNLKSNPKRLGDDKHFTLLEDGKVIGSTSGDMTEEFDKDTPSIKGWIITLASELEHRMGRCLINEYPKMPTNITVHAFDVDVKSAYPWSEIALNVSKTTRFLELCKVNGLTVPQTRAIGINMTNVNANALSLARTCFSFPELDVLLTRFEDELNTVNAVEQAPKKETEEMA